MSDIHLPEGDEVQGEEQHPEVLAPETSVLPGEPSLENKSKSSESITTLTDDGSYYVTWTVYVALAIPQGEEVHSPVKSSTSSQMKPFKAQSWYHIEYNLLLGDTETAKMDLIVFGPVAKLYRGEESQILKTWKEDGQAWLGWAQSFNVRVDRDLLISLVPHSIDLQIWNTRDKLCSQARYDRLKGCKALPSQLEESENVNGCIKTIVNKLRGQCAKKANVMKKPKLDDSCISKSKLDLEKEQKTSLSKLVLEANMFEDIQQAGTATVVMDSIRLMAGATSMTEQFPLYSAGVMEVMCQVSLDKPLFSDQLRKELNPLVITILSATSMPSTPIPFHVLQERCQPAYCLYKFYNSETHRTKAQKQNMHIDFSDVNVILTGLMSSEELLEFFHGPPLHIEVHDRDRKLDEVPKTLVAFETEQDIDTESCASPLEENRSVNAYGVVKLDLSDLLHGRTYLKFHLPIKCRPPSVPPDRKQNEGKWKPEKSDPKDIMPQGHYHDANSQLIVKVEIAVPINRTMGIFGTQPCSGLFGRIIYLFSGKNSTVMTQLRSEILQINAAAFHLGSRSLEKIVMALSNYRMNFKHDESNDEDFISGFHLLDNRIHIFVLEGLKHKAVRRLWETVPMKLSESEKEQVVVLYNSDLSFFKRIYVSLDVSLSPIQLYQPLQSIMSNPLTYIRGRIPRLCLQALQRLSQLCQVKQLSEVVHYDLFPSANMVVSLGEELGTGEWTEQRVSADIAEEESPQPVSRKQYTPMNTYNTKYIRWKHDRQLKDFIQENVKKAHEKREWLQEPQPAASWMAGWRSTACQQYQSATLERMTSHTGLTSRPSVAWLPCITSPTAPPPRPHEARVEELRKPWRENVLHANLLTPPLSRDAWGWSQRWEDFELRRRPPPFFSPSPATIHLAGERLRQEQLQAAAAAATPKRWLQGLLAATGGAGPLPSQFKCHMRKVNLEKLQDVLKDEPKKYSLRKPGLALKPFPQLYVLNLSDDKAEGEKRVAMAPGPRLSCSLNSRNNAIPRHSPPTSKHHRFKVHLDQSFLYKPTSLPERSTATLHED